MLLTGGPAVLLRCPTGESSYRESMTPLRDSTARTRELGAVLRRIREDARYTGAELARKLGWGQSKVSRLESGDRGATEVEVAVFAAFCGAKGDELKRILNLANKVDDNHWLHVRGDRLPDELCSVIALETTADVITYYEPIVIPGLLQTEDYARALFHETDVLPVRAIESRVRSGWSGSTCFVGCGPRRQSRSMYTRTRFACRSATTASCTSRCCIFCSRVPRRRII
jgi:transcriptional regulator with XRE-family HTH domain